MRNALVTGGAGFIGSHLVEALLARNIRVRVLDDLSTGNPSNLSGIIDRIQLLRGDVRDPDLLARAVEGCDAVFHLAAVVSVPKTVEDPVGSAMVNDLGTLRVLEASRRAGARKVVLASSCAVYGDDLRLPKEEDMLPRPMTPYAVQKLAGELNARIYHRLFGVDTVSLRYFNVYGPRQDPSSPYSGVISLFLTRAVSGAQPVIYGDGTQSRDFVFVADVVKANLLAAESGPAAGGEVFNIGSGASVSIRELWQTIRKLAGSPLEPLHAAPRAGDVQASRSDIRRAREYLGFSPELSLEAGLGITIDWYRRTRR